MAVAVEWRKDMHVWLPGKEGSEEPFIGGKITAISPSGALTLRMDGGTEQTVDPAKVDVLPGNEPGSMAPDHCGLINMNEPCVLENSRLRFLADNIYTLVGTIMIAVNPFAKIDIYGADKMQPYSKKELGDPRVESHLYAMGEAAYRTLLRSQSSAALVMSGESGAGKTETAKHLMNYIAWCSGNAGDGSSGGIAQKLANMIIASSPLLEAFGNAKTVRNNNSSRFGKMMRLHFKPNGEMAGAFIKTYLLEKIRCVAITSPERNYHVFYQLLAARPEPAKGKVIGSMTPQSLNMLNKSSCTQIDGVDDTDGFTEIVGAMGELGISGDKQKQLWSVLSGVLCLGNIEFDSDGGDKAVVQAGSTETLAAAEECLACKNLAVNLTSKDSGRKSLGALKLTKLQAQAARDAAVKDIFVHLFHWVVGCVNDSIKGSDGSSKLSYIGLLDIFGFEVFKFNSFEQLCINFTNEKLQQFFLMSVFRAEEEEHEKENVTLTKVEIQDNQPCIDLLEGKPSGIFLLLDTQCKTPNGNEGGFLKAVNETHTKASKFLASARSSKLRDEEGFVVKHFAGNVAYHSSDVVAKTTKLQEVNWLEKNNDALDVGWLQKLAHSGHELLTSVYKDDLEAAKHRRGATSVGKRFLGDVKSLLDELGSVKPFFIRCIKPNHEKVAKKFTISLVLEQLRCSGLMGAVRLMQEAYPTRVQYSAIFEQAEKLIGKAAMEKMKCHPPVFSEKVMQIIGKGDTYALGRTKLFLKAGGGAFLQDLRECDSAKLAKDIMAKLEASRRSMYVTFRVAVYAAMWRRRTFAKFEAAAKVITHCGRAYTWRRRHKLWRAARARRLAEEAAAANAQELQAKREAELAEKLESVREMAAQAKKVELEKIEKQAAEEKEAAIAAAREKILEEALASEGNAEKSKEELLEDPEISRAVEESVQEAEAKAAAIVEEKAKEQDAEIEAHLKGAEERLQKEVFEGADSDVCHEFVERLAEAKGEKPPPPKNRPKRVSIIPPRASGGAPLPTSAGLFAGMGGDDEAGAPGEAAPKAVAAAPKARNRAFTLAGSFGKEEGETFQITLETEDSTDPVGLTVELWNGELVVLNIAPGSCADTEGSLSIGDVLLSIDGTACTSVDQVQRQLRGKRGKDGVFDAEEEDEATGTGSLKASGGSGKSDGGGSTKSNGSKKLSDKIGVGKAKGKSQMKKAKPKVVTVQYAPGYTDERGIYVPGPELPAAPPREGCEFVLTVMRRPLTYTLRSDVEILMPGGAWEPFSAEVRSNRTVTYDQHKEPHLCGEILLDDLIGVAASTSDDGEKTLQIYTRHKVVDMRPKRADFRAWRLRLQELLMTRESMIFDGWLFKERAVEKTDEVTSTKEPTVSQQRWTPYWCTLYANGVLLYFSDPESAQLGQARGVLTFDRVQMTSKAKRKIREGDHVRVVSGKSANLNAVVISEKRNMNGQAKYRVQLQEANTQFDASPSKLSYWYEGADKEPCCSIDDRGIASTTTISIIGGAGANEEEWRLGVDSKESGDQWFKHLLQYRNKQHILESPEPIVHATTDPTFEDVALANGFIDVLGWQEELCRSQVDEEADKLAHIRNIAANILAFAGASLGEQEAEKEADDATSNFPSNEVELEWTSRWFVLRPSGLYLYSAEQKGEEWEDPALTIPMSDVVAAAAATGADFFKAIFVLERTSGRELQLRASSRHEMRRYLGLLHLHCLKPPGGDMRAWPRSILMAGWLFQKAPTTVASRTAAALGFAPRSRFQTMVLDGAQWRMLWVVLDAPAARLAVADKTTSDLPQLNAFMAESDPQVVASFPLRNVARVSLEPRMTDAGQAHANFALHTDKKRFTFAAQSAEMAREWVRVIEEAIQQTHGATDTAARV